MPRRYPLPPGSRSSGISFQGGPWLPRGRVPQALRPQEEAALCHHDVPGLEPGEDGVAIADRLAHADLALDELALFVLDRNIDDRALAERLHGGPRHDDGPLLSSGGEHHGHIHAEPQSAVAVRNLDADLGGARLSIDTRIDVGYAAPEGRGRVDRRRDGRL